MERDIPGAHFLVSGPPFLGCSAWREEMCGASVGGVDVKKTLRCFLKEGLLIFFRFDCQVMNTTGYVSRGFKLVTNLAAGKWAGFMP
jgi:hypothetical protein